MKREKIASLKVTTYCGVPLDVSFLLVQLSDGHTEQQLNTESEKEEEVYSEDKDQATEKSDQEVDLERQSEGSNEEKT